MQMEKLMESIYFRHQLHTYTPHASQLDGKSRREEKKRKEARLRKKLQQLCLYFNCCV